VTTACCAPDIPPPLPACGLTLLAEQALFERVARQALEIAGNAFLFDVVADPMERGNLREREPGTFAALSAEWDAWNATMLPPDPLAQTHGFNGRDLAEYYGIDS
jgi:hypothetical protein